MLAKFQISRQMSIKNLEEKYLSKLKFKNRDFLELKTEKKYIARPEESR
jgi:hypothetical protein